MTMLAGFIFISRGSLGGRIPLKSAIMRHDDQASSYQSRHKGIARPSCCSLRIPSRWGTTSFHWALRPRSRKPLVR